jgi:hypothetical protein
LPTVRDSGGDDSAAAMQRRPAPDTRKGMGERGRRALTQPTAPIGAEKGDGARALYSQLPMRQTPEYYARTSTYPWRAPERVQVSPLSGAQPRLAPLPPLAAHQDGARVRSMIGEQLGSENYEARATGALWTRSTTEP